MYFSVLLHSKSAVTACTFPDNEGERNGGKLTSVVKILQYKTCIRMTTLLWWHLVVKILIVKHS